MSAAKEYKQREWKCNIFDQTTRDEKPLFDRKRRSDNSQIFENSRERTIGKRNDSRENSLSKRQEGTFLQSSIRAHTPNLVDKRMKESETMRKLL